MRALALGSVVFRTLEAAFYLIGAMSLLALLKLSGQFAVAGVADRASLQAIGDALLSLRTYAASLLGVFAFCVGGFLYNLLFFRARLLPRWLSGFGIDRDTGADGGLPALPVQWQPHHQLHPARIPHLRAGARSRRVVDSQGLRHVRDRRRTGGAGG